MSIVKVLLVMLVSTCLAHAVTTGTIRGTAADPTGAAIPNAQVTVVNEGTNETRKMATDSGGAFEFLLLPVGTYTLRVEHSDFKAYVLSGIGLAVNQVASFNVALELGAVESKVEVQASPIQVDTVTTQVGTVIGSRPILDLPLNGRNVYQLVALQPGISVPNQGTQSIVEPNNPIYDFKGGSPLVFSSGGGRLVMNNFMVDGGDTNGILDNQAVIKLMPDAVEEFRVVTNTFNAELGRNAGSVVNIVTKSGTNQWHGDAFEFLRNDALNARNFFEVDRAPFKLNQFGGTVGGPIRKDKTFFFASFQESRRRQGVPGTLQRVFSGAERSGDFSVRNSVGFSGSLSKGLSGNFCFPRDVPGASNCFPPATPYSAIFPGAKIPTSFFDPVAQNIITNLLPRANVGGEFLSLSPVQPENDHQVSLKLDHDLKEGHKLSAFYYFDDDTMNLFGQLPTNMPGFPATTKERDQQLSLTETWVINPTTVNEFRFSALRQALGEEGNPLHPMSPASFGFTGIKTGIPANLQSLPVINIKGGPVWGSPGGGSGGGSDIQNVFQFADNFSKVKGHHTLKFGGDYRRNRYDQELVFVFDGQFCFGGGGSNSTGDAFADFVLGLPDVFSQGSASFERLRSHQLNFYGQDSWQIRPNLTLNYGVRWELDTPFVEQQDAISVFRFPPASGQPAPQSQVFPTAPPGLLFPGDPGVPRGLYQTYYRSFGPRIGLAYSPNWLGANKLVIRAAYGIFYNPVEQAVLLQFNGDPPYGGSSFVSDPGFATPYFNQFGSLLPSPFPFIPPQRGQRIDFSSFIPIFQFGNFLPDQRTQSVEQFNFMLEYQLSPSTVVSAGYVGGQGHRLLASYDLNPGNAALCLSAQLASQSCGPYGEDFTYTGPSGQPIYGTRPVGPISNNPSLALENFANIFTLHTISNSNYNSGQLRVEHRASNLDFLAAYTLSKSIDNTSGFENFLNPFCFRCERTLSGFDARHRFVFSSTYSLPFSRLGSSHGILRKALDGWEVGGIVSFQSGIPVRLTDSASDNSLTGGFDFEAADRPDIVGRIQTQDPRKNGIGMSGAVVPNQFFNPSAFAVERLGKFGNASHNMFAGPGVNNWDFTIIKRTQIKERLTWEFRAELFNLFNHAQFLNPSGDIGAGDSFGEVTAARDPRFVQFGMKITF